jgi:uncharacterized membrane protein
VFMEQGISELKELNSESRQEQEQNCATTTTITKSSSERQFEQLLSKLLKYGVLIASTVVLIGGILYLIAHGAEPANYSSFQGEPPIFCSPTGVLTAALSGNCNGIIQLGLLLLIATPIIRVIVSLLTFLWQRDFIYVTVTSLVLAGLVYSIIGAYAS